MQANKSIKYFLILCGLVLTMSASAVFAQEGPQFNKRPLQDFAAAVKDKINKKEVDLTAPFTIEFQGDLSKDGKLDLKTSKFGKTEGDPQMINLAKTGVEAINDAGYFAYLSKFSVTKFQLTLSQTKERFSALINATTISEAQAKSNASTINLLLSLGKQNFADKKREEDADTLLLLNGAKITTDGAALLISVEMPDEAFQRLLKKELDKVK